MGVSRAINKAEILSKGGEEIYTYGPLIHNPQVIAELEKKRIKVAKNLNELKNSTLIIRTHGVTPKERLLIEKSVKLVCDFTCPRVAKVQDIINKYAKMGYKIIIIGDKTHPEVKALMGYALNRGFVVNKESDLKKLPKRSKICVVSQTTMNQNLFTGLSSKLSKLYKEVVVFNTICDTTSKRQNEVLELCKFVDAMIIIGGKNSSNTTRLAEVSRKAGVKAYHIETERELDLKEIKKYNSIGVTAGASTPKWMIERVLDKLKSYET